jgi:hypothetical protein
LARKQLYFKLVATIEANATEAEIDSFLSNLYQQQSVKDRFLAWRNDFKVAINWIVGRPAAVARNARVVEWHFHREDGTVEHEEIP